MRDIQSDLRERLELAESERANVAAAYEAERQSLEGKYKPKLASAEAEITAIKSLLDIEARRAGSHAPFALPTLPIKDFLVKAVRDNGPLAKEQLRDLATEAGYFHTDESPGRVTHGVVLSLTRSRQLIKNEDGTFHLPPEVAGKGQNGVSATAAAETLI